MSATPAAAGDAPVPLSGRELRIHEVETTSVEDLKALASDVLRNTTPQELQALYDSIRRYEPGATAGTRRRSTRSGRRRKEGGKGVKGERGEKKKEKRCEQGQARELHTDTAHRGGHCGESRRAEAAVCRKSGRAQRERRKDRRGGKGWSHHMSLTPWRALLLLVNVNRGLVWLLLCVSPGVRAAPLSCATLLSQTHTHPHPHIHTHTLPPIGAFLSWICAPAPSSPTPVALFLSSLSP